MSSKSKRKGSTFERLVVNEAKLKGLSAERAYASNGRSLGCSDTVDVLIKGLKGQCKVRHKLSKVVRPDEDIDIQIIKEDRGDTFVVMKYSKFLELLCPNN